jgi:tetratricopeptide (TPR) repeat protein
MSTHYPTGTLGTTPLAHLLVYSHGKRLSGTFELTCRGGASATMTVHEGNVAKVRTSEPIAYLGTVLYESGVICDRELNASLAEVASRRTLHGRVLIDRGSITRDQLGVALREQTLRKLAHMFGFTPETTFAFKPNTDMLSGYGANDFAPIDPWPAIWRGIREYPSEGHLRKVIASVVGVRCRLAPGAQPERLDLEDDAYAAVEQLRRRPMTLEEFATARSIGQRRAELLLYCLLITKQLELSQAPARQPTTGQSAPAVSEINIPKAQQPPIDTRAVPLRGRTLAGEEDLSISGCSDALSGARACFAREDLERAERLCRRAHQEQPGNAEALALLAWIEALRPTNHGVDETRKRISMLSRALDLDDHCENALLWRAQLYKRIENHPAAIRDFKRVLQLNEENLDAMRELRVYEMRVRHKSLTMRSAAGGARRSSSPGMVTKRSA